MEMFTPPLLWWFAKSKSSINERSNLYSLLKGMPQWHIQKDNGHRLVLVTRLCCETNAKTIGVSHAINKHSYAQSVNHKV